MSHEERTTATDSPWFWVLVFSLMALAALVAMGPKYGRRQAGLELKYQARERLAEERQSGNNLPGHKRSEDATGERPPLASPSDTLVPLWPLAAVLLAAALFSAGMLFRGGRARPGALPDEGPP